ncbi:MAG: hypothetical protein KGP29_07155 [Proteobacteria bacterium]|nr:hypothetical protein [Pseudomonadota bacterium]
MKNFLVITSLLTLISCAHHDQKIKFSFDIESQKQKVGHGVGIDLVMVDDRPDEVIGTKEYGPEEKIKIGSSENLAESLQKKIFANLLKRGFKNGWDSSLEIHVLKLDYRAKSEFFIGTSEARAAIKVVATNNRTGSSLTKNFSSSLDGKHFIRPLDSTDEALINKLIQELVESILDDEEVLNKLVK